MILSWLVKFYAIKSIVLKFSTIVIKLKLERSKNKMKNRSISQSDSTNLYYLKLLLSIHLYTGCILSPFHILKG